MKKIITFMYLSILLLSIGCAGKTADVAASKRRAAVGGLPLPYMTNKMNSKAEEKIREERAALPTSKLLLEDFSTALKQGEKDKIVSFFDKKITDGKIKVKDTEGRNYMMLLLDPENGYKGSDEDLMELFKKYFKNIVEDINAIDAKRESLIFYAVYRKNPELVAELLEHGNVKVNILNAAERTVIFESIRLYTDTENAFNIFKLLVDKGADFDINFTINNGITALIFACTIGNEKIVSYLLEKGANINMKTNSLSGASGISAIIMAAYKGYEEIIAMLLQSGAKFPSKTKLLMKKAYKRLKGPLQGAFNTMLGNIAQSCGIPAIWPDLPLPEGEDGHEYACKKIRAVHKKGDWMLGKTNNFNDKSFRKYSQLLECDMKDDIKKLRVILLDSEQEIKRLIADSRKEEDKMVWLAMLYSVSEINKFIKATCDKDLQTAIYRMDQIHKILKERGFQGRSMNKVVKTFLNLKKKLPNAIRKTDSLGQEFDIQLGKEMASHTEESKNRDIDVKRKLKEMFDLFIPVYENLTIVKEGAVKRVKEFVQEFERLKSTNVELTTSIIKVFECSSDKKEWRWIDFNDSRIKEKILKIYSKD